ncbi:hypothetical protein SASPL_116939 [Salvia splendens]|uniref:HMA domain-containing protein n=1 Tax=Salvia splendens TaxID=180675 RepID=A0A8X8XXD2_SALSN|nr:hypothetical protein SASPL_116939 [Salvia splendens]
MAKTAAMMLAAVLVMSALVSSSWAATEADSTALPVQIEDDPASSGKVFKVCNSVEGCGGEGGSVGGNRKLLSDSEAPATAMQSVEKGAEDLKTKRKLQRLRRRRKEEAPKAAEDGKKETEAPPPQEIVLKKNHRHVELISPISKPPTPPEEPQKQPEKVEAKVEEKKEEPSVITVVLGDFMHCDACAQEIRKRILIMKGIERAEPNLANSQVTVKGVMGPKALADYVYKKNGKHAAIVKNMDRQEERGSDRADAVKKAVPEMEKSWPALMREEKLLPGQAANIYNSIRPRGR